MSTVKEMQELLELGTQMGLKEEALQKFVKEEQSRLRDERERQRKERKSKEEREFQLQMERELTEREREEREHIRQMEEQKELFDDSEHKRKIVEMELDHKFQLLATERSHKVLDSSSHGTEMHQPIKGPKLPAFDDSKDNIDAYIQRFEIYATSQKWLRDNWEAHLSALLKGKALDVFSRLPPESAIDFDELKKALLKRFDMTEDGFRKKFRSSKPDGSEFFMQFSELALFLKERIPPSIQEMAPFADQFAEARNITSSSSTQRLVSDRKIQADKQFHSMDRVVQSKSNSGGKCFVCGKVGHKSFDCVHRKFPSNKIVSATEKQETVPKQYQFSDPKSGTFHGRNIGYYGRGGGRQDTSAVLRDETLPSVGDSVAISEIVMPSVKGCVGDKLITVLRDTGCSGVVIRKDLVGEDHFTGKTQKCKLADGRVIEAQVATVEVDTPYFTGNVDAWCFDCPSSYDLILGNIQGVRKPHEPNMAWIHSTESTSAVETRGQLNKKKSSYKPLKVPSAIQDVSPEELQKEQRDDKTLKKLKEMADKGTVKQFSDGGSSKMYYRKELLYREFNSPIVSIGKVFRQLITPKQYRDMVRKLAHESIMAGHLGVKKTTDRIMVEFYWPGIQADIGRFCKSCDVCQRTIPKGKFPAVPLGQMPLIPEPFQRVAVDIIGPLQPIAVRGNRYILTVVDYATRYPEAIALPGIETERVAEALVDIFSRVGVPTEMLSDQGTQFTSEVIKEVSRLLSFKRITTTPYNPMCNGLMEKFNGTLKQMLKRMCAERPKDWDKYLYPLLFAYREVPQESLGFSPFDLLYPHSVRGPMMIVKELLTKEIPNEEVKTTYQYVLDLRERLEETCKIAHEHLENARKQRFTPEQQQTVESLCEQFNEVFTDIPGTTNLVKHKIELTSAEPVRVKQYPISFSTENVIREEVEMMLQLEVIEHSSYLYSAPVVIARKKDGTNRFCIDFRKLNNITVFDAEPITNPDSIFS
ncbi:uncharacterized protein LOC133202481 [Saccostrea echinata]|uniref:uncharacterized protein LOC133202481 n=1 Tax=Saccostrea echinata TaxID=191078 RepID=UPI002A839972|nr:uncharacterized protein LOC133202481 [Saccostrea echinata]